MYKTSDIQNHPNHVEYSSSCNSDDHDNVNHPSNIGYLVGSSSGTKKKKYHHSDLADHGVWYSRNKRSYIDMYCNQDNSEHHGSIDGVAKNKRRLRNPLPKSDGCSNLDMGGHLNSSTNEDSNITDLWKVAISNTISTPDVKKAISSVVLGDAQDRLIKQIVKEQVAKAVFKNPHVSKHFSACGYSTVQCRRSDIPAKCTTLAQNKSPGPETDHQEDLSLLGSYIKELFKSNNIDYGPDHNNQKTEQLLIDYQSKFLLRKEIHRVLPFPVEKVGVLNDVYCSSCKLEFKSAAELKNHTQYDYIHLIITGKWWGTNPIPPKYLPLLQKVRQPNYFVWCVICLEKHRMGCNESLFTHLKSTHHQFNLCCWKECYDTWPAFDWCMWKDVEPIEHLLPRASVNGFDWPQHVQKMCIPINIDLA